MPPRKIASWLGLGFWVRVSFGVGGQFSSEAIVLEPFGITHLESMFLLRRNQEVDLLKQELKIFHIFTVANQLPGFSNSRSANGENFFNVIIFFNCKYKCEYKIFFLFKYICVVFYT